MVRRAAMDLLSSSRPSSIVARYGILLKTMMLSALTRKSTAFASRRSISTYMPTMVEKREGEAGVGGRSSEAGLKVAVFGGSGFLGHYVCGELGTNGFMAYLANRGDDMEMRHIKVSFDLGRTRFVFFSPRDRESIKEVIADADVVVNMMGKYYESGQPIAKDKFPYVSYKTNYSFHDANVLIPQTLAEICKEMQVDNFIHVSSASSSPDSKSEWSRTKYEGELAVKEAYPWATIIRPSQLFGKQDKFLNWFARMAQWNRMVPLVNGGTTLTQPVFVGDVAKTILRVIDEPKKFEGKQIDCFGPNDYTYLELAKFVNDITERDKRIFNLPHYYYSRLAKVMQYQRDPLITPDLVELMTEDNVPKMTAEEYKASGILTMKDVGIEPMALEKHAFDWLHHYRVGGHFYRVQGYH